MADIEPSFPEGVVRHIVTRLCLDKDTPGVNQCLLALRSCSKIFQNASDDARRVIKLCPHDLTQAFSLISKCQGISVVTISLSPAQASNAQDVFLLNQVDFSLLSQKVPKLDSLTVHGTNSTSINFQYECITQLPSLHNLRTLDLTRCTILIPIMGNQPLPGILLTWSLIIPQLHTFKMTHALLTTLDLSNSPKLHELELQYNVLLTSVTLSDTRSVRKLSYLHNMNLPTLDLSGYSNLSTLHVEGTNQLVNLVLTDCTALKQVDCISNASLTTIGLSGCISLQNLHVRMNVSLDSFDLSHLNHLVSLVCIDNSVLPGIHMHSSFAKRVVLQGNDQLTEVDLSGCTSLQQVGLLCNDLIKELDFSGLDGLEAVSCEDNQSLKSALFRNCPSLKSIEFKDNQSLEDIDCSGCVSLQILSCPNHNNLEHISFHGCKAMWDLDASGCPKYVSYGRGF